MEAEKKTAMQELIDFAWESLDSNPMSIIRKAEKLLEKEKEQIVIAWNDHRFNKWGNENTIVDGDHYYNQTFQIKQ